MATEKLPFKKRRSFLTLLLRSMVAPTLVAPYLSGCGGGNTGSNNNGNTSNALPIAIISASSTVNVYTNVKLDGGKSYDPEGKALTYTWTWLKRPPASRAEFSNANTVAPSFYVDEPGVYELALVVNDGVNSSAASTVSIQANLNNSAQKTVVLRFVNTDRTWGQEVNPGWPNASPVKVAENYCLYDIEIARNEVRLTERLSAYKFIDFSVAQLMSESFPRYREKSLVFQGTLDGSSSSLREQLIGMTKKIATVEQAERVVVFYSGHGAPSIFFEGALDFADAKLFLSNLKSAFNNPTVILDFSTNCSVGYLDFAWQVKDSADYLLASDLNVGGFNIDQFELWLSNNHDTNLHRLYDPKKSLAQCFDAITQARQTVWSSGSVSIKENKVQQSISIYNLYYLYPLLKQIKTSTTFSIDNDLAKNNNNLATWITNYGNSTLSAAFTKFQTHYTSNQSLFTWPNNPLGFGVENVGLAREIVKSVN